MSHSEALLLAGDIGATKTTLGLYPRSALDQPGSEPIREESFQNRSFSCFDDVLAVFLGTGSPVPPYACIGIAGPVADDTAVMTNLHWQLDARTLEKRHGFTQVCLINDLVATALFVPYLASHALGAINSGVPKSPGVLAVIAPGTGLGEAFLIPHPSGKKYMPCASEGGHASFAPQNDEQMQLLQFMLQRRTHVSFEDVCSSRAVPSLFAFMGRRHTVPEWLDSEVARAENPTPVIVGAARRAAEGKRVCGVAMHTMRLLCDILADEAANLVLKTMALGGLYLGGGFALQLQPFLQQDRFMRIFTRNHTSSLLEHVPVHFILDRRAALHGAGEYGLRTLARTQAATGKATSHPPPIYRA